MWGRPAEEAYRNPPIRPKIPFSTPNYSLGVVVAILSVYIKLLALRKDQKNRISDFREILI